MASMGATRSTPSSGPIRSLSPLMWRRRTQKSTNHERSRDSHLINVDTNPAYWGISLADLDFFQQEVWNLWTEGLIPDDPSAPNPYHEDEQIGPNIYQVNKLYIKPTTLEAGGMSWALMRNPSGLKCDIFASHAWAEGAWEFCWKVRVSWPRNARGLYCCFLANPQNGDITGLLGSNPLHSPFARALQVCSHVIIVPNRRVSVYSRLWCVFEAHLAMEYGIQIAMPTQPRAKSVIFRMLPYFLLISSAFLLFAKLEGQHLVQAASPWSSLNFQRLLVLFVGPCAFYAPRLYVSSLCIALGWQLAYFVMDDGDSFRMALSVQSRAKGMAILVDNLTAMGLALASFEFVVTELAEEALFDEVRQLEIDTVQNASCSDERDGLAIRRIISGREPAIDKMITLLKEVGRYDNMVEANLRRGMSPLRVRYGVKHMRGVGGCSHWMEGLTRTVAAAANGHLATITLECGLAMNVICCIGIFCLTLRWGDGAAYFADTLLWSGLTNYFVNEVLRDVCYKQTLGTVYYDRSHPMEAMGYGLALIGVGAVAISRCMCFYELLPRSCSSQRSQEDSTDTEEASEPTSEASG